MKKILLAAAYLLLAVPCLAAQVVPTPSGKLPKMPEPGLFLTSSYTSGPAPVIDKMKMTVEQMLGRLVPNGWRVYCETGLVGELTEIEATPKETWMSALERWMDKSGARGLAKTDSLELFVRRSEGGYERNLGADWRPSAGSGVWTIRGGESLRKQLGEWCRMAGYQLFWEAITDYEMKGSTAFEGSFEAAIQELFDVLYRNGELSLKASLYRGNKVIRVRQD